MKKHHYILIIIILLASFLRLWKLSKIPVSLFGDELDVGYQAYSVLKTGRDYYGNFMPIHFHSLAEYRTPLYLYSTVPTVAIFGISPLGVRLPAAIFGIFTIWLIYLLVRELTKNKKLSLISAFVLAISPWHIQYSRAGFEVTELLFFLILGLILFFKALKNSKYLWISAACLSIMPWIYSTAKLFTPFIFLFLFLFWFKKIVSFPKKHLAYALITGAIILTPITVSTFVGGGAERFGYISVFTNPQTENEVGVARLNDAKVRGEIGEGISPRIDDRIFHNKYTFWLENVISNYLEAFSTNFLFISGDPNLRHSIQGMGELYRVDFLPLLFGIILFFTSKLDKKHKTLIAFWALAGVIPAAITRDGGNHATRLILILPPLIFLISYGVYKMPKLLLLSYLFLLFINFIFYQHDFWIHNPRYSERWWHYGFEQAIDGIKANQDSYDKVVLTTADEPPWLFFAAWYKYPPEQWQKSFPIGNDVDLQGFGKVSHIGKFYFGSPGVGVYDMGKVIDSKTLYLVSAKEVNVNLIQEPERLPKDLNMIEAIAYPSGEPAFYLFSGK